MIPQMVSIGNNFGSRRFDDQLSVKGASKIRKIIISCNDQHLHGIQFQYKTSNSLIDGESSLKWNPLLYDIKSFSVDDDDVITEIFGSYDTEIHQLGFRTMKNDMFVCGKSKGKVFHFKFDGYTFSSANGTLEKYLNTLTFHLINIEDLELKLDKKQLRQREKIKNKKLNHYKLHLIGTILGADQHDNNQSDQFDTFPKEFFEPREQREMELKNFEFIKIQQ